MAKNFITGIAQGVTNSVERMADLRKRHPEWDRPPSAKALARERLRPVKLADIGDPHEGDEARRVSA
jgi:hypothetical protein